MMCSTVQIIGIYNANLGCIHNNFEGYYALSTVRLQLQPNLPNVKTTNLLLFRDCLFSYQFPLVFECYHCLLLDYSNTSSTSCLVIDATAQTQSNIVWLLLIHWCCDYMNLMSFNVTTRPYLHIWSFHALVGEVLHVCVLSYYFPVVLACHHAHSRGDSTTYNNNI